MRWLSAGMRIGLACGLGACCAYQPPNGAPSKAERRLPLPLTLQAAAARACATGRWVGVPRPGSRECPQLGEGWIGRPLYDLPMPDRYGDAAGEAAQAQSAGPELICLYQHQGDGGPTPPPPPSPDLIRLDQDCAAMVPTSAQDDLEEMSFQLLHSHFKKQVGYVDQLPEVPTPPVRLSFLDTQPTGVGAPITDEKNQHREEHGYTLAHLGRELVCGGRPPGDEKIGKCAAQITTRLALPVVAYDPKHNVIEKDEVKGGYFGTIGDLAKAIVDEVRDWDDCRRSPGRKGCFGKEQHLVLNLSVGWDGELFGGRDEAKACELKAPMQAVYGALRYARARGVLVIAAAGNNRAGSRRAAGPLLPAAWESKLEFGEPLVYAAGGLQADGRQLVSSRPQSMPLRGAFADHVVAEDGGGAHLRALTGTSVAAAVVSSVAAVVWHYRPELNRADVMSLLSRPKAGLQLGAPDFPLGSAGAHAERVMLCNALCEACRPGNCPAPWSVEKTCLDNCAYAAEESNFAADLYRAIAPFTPNHAPLDASTFRALQPVPLVCSSSDIRYDGGRAPDDPCPGDEVLSIADVPWVYPQPECNPCPTCTGGGGRPPGGVALASLSSAPPQASPPWLRVKIREDLQYCLEAVTLQVEGTDAQDNPRTFSYALSQSLCRGDSLELTAPPELAQIHQVNAWMSYIDDKSHLSVLSPVLIPYP
ncbi:MAG TPA: S8 family serine peptidase [Thermoanaerobaculia bacterium]|nr:S8 family serine peptidase [Thermoanaerobaculia bacterium]